MSLKLKQPTQNPNKIPAICTYPFKQFVYFSPTSIQSQFTSHRETFYVIYISAPLSCPDFFFYFLLNDLISNTKSPTKPLGIPSTSFPECKFKYIEKKKYNNFGVSSDAYKQKPERLFNLYLQTLYIKYADTAASAKIVCQVSLNS